MDLKESGIESCKDFWADISGFNAGYVRETHAPNGGIISLFLCQIVEAKAPKAKRASLDASS